MPKNRTLLDSDHLGALGEAKFRQMCEEVELICNKSDRDRAGWDFIVTFPFPKDRLKNTTLDSRKAPPSCHVQVKTIWEWNDQIKLRLSSAEWLAKELKPAFIYVLKLNEARQFTDGFLIHIFDAPLSTILRRLRVEEAKKNTAPNKTVISMTPRKLASKIEVTGDALLTAMQSACGEDLEQYITSKSEQLKKLGFDGASIHLKLNFHFENDEEMVEAFLGLKTSVRATDLKTSETRFGITLPVAEHAEALVSISPQPADTCTILVRSPDFSFPATFKGKVFFPPIPNLAKEMFKVRLDAGLFSILMARDNYHITTDAGTAVQTVSTWASYWKLFTVLANGKGVIEVISDTDRFRVSIDVAKEADGEKVKQGRIFVAASEGALRLLKIAGVYKEPEITASRLQYISQHLVLANAIAGPTDEKVSLTIDNITNDNAMQGEKIEIAFISYIPFGGLTLGYYASITLMISIDENSVKGTSTEWKMGEVRALGKLPESYDEFIETAKEKTGLELFHAVPLPEGI